MNKSRYSIVGCIISVILSACTVFSVAVFADDKKPVTIIDGNTTKTVQTAATTAEEILAENNIVLGEHDKANLTADNSGIVLKVVHAFPVHVSIGNGEPKTVYTTPCTVAEALALLNITLDKDDICNYQSTDTLEKESTIDIIDGAGFAADQAAAATTTVTYPKKQRKTHKSTVKAVTTAQQSAKCISTLQPASEIELDQNGVPVSYSKCLTFGATAYTSSGSARCSTGAIPQPGRVAVNPKVIPYGTKMYIVSADGKYTYGYAIASDTGGFAKKHPYSVDLYMSTETQCVQFGRRSVKIYILD